VRCQPKQSELSLRSTEAAALDTQGPATFQ
jgi:hypothetical protein